MRRLLLLLCPLLLLLGGCGRNTGPDLARFAPAEEDRLVLYTSHKEELYGPIIREFEARTGIWVQVETGGTSALLERGARSPLRIPQSPAPVTPPWPPCSRPCRGMMRRFWPPL